MPRTCREDELLTKAHKIQRNDTEAYLDFRDMLAADIAEYIGIIQAYVSKGQWKGETVDAATYKAAYALFKYWSDELKDTNGTIPVMENTLRKQRKERLGESDSPIEAVVEEEDNVSPIQPAVTFSKKAAK